MNGHFEAITSRVDPDGIIRGVSVATIGEARGHNIWIDDKTLALFQALSTKHPNGVKSKSKHGTNFDAIVGALKDFRIDGTKLIADLHLLKEHPQYSHIVELAEKLPGEFGLSASCDYHKESIGGKDYARPVALNSVDIVDQPAANPSGLFSAQVDTPQSTRTQTIMEDKDKTLLDQIRGMFSKSDQLSAALTEAQTAKAQLEAKSGEFSALRGELEAKTKELSDLKETHKAELEAKEADVEKRAAAKASQIAASQGIPALKGDMNDTSGGAKDFSGFVADYVKGGKSKSEAVQLAIKNHPKEYLEAREKGPITL